MPVRFECTSCGRCCHDLRLPLSVREAADWLARGGSVELLCDAAPAVAGEDDYWTARAFAAHSGTLPINVHVILTATFAGPCPFLRADLLCGAYEQRPAACRIYPAEVNPARALLPTAKQCPPEAWTDTAPVLIADDGKPADATLAAVIARSRAETQGDAAVKRWICASLGIDRVALRNEGFVIWSPDQARLHGLLADPLQQSAVDVAGPDWRFVAGRAAVRAMIAEAGAHAVPATGPGAITYHGFHADDVPA